MTGPYRVLPGLGPIIPRLREALDTCERLSGHRPRFAVCGYLAWFSLIAEVSGDGVGDPSTISVDGCECRLGPDAPLRFVYLSYPDYDARQARAHWTEIFAALSIAFGSLSLIGPALEWFDRCYEINISGHYLREEESRS